MIADSPLHMVRGQGCYLYNTAGVAYLDCVNNVAHLGHAHPKVRLQKGLANHLRKKAQW